MYFRQIFFIACITAIIASLGFSLYQFYFVTPLIYAAEVYEISDAMPNLQEPWSPESDLERSLYTLLANFLMSLAYGLLLGVAMVFKGKTSIYKGFIWGLAAYLSLFVAPSLGLTPEIPGMEAADLSARQNWWLLSVLLTAVGLSVLAFAPRLYKGMGIILLMLPHLIGAPQPEHHGFAHPDPEAVLVLMNLWQQFIVQTSIANALLWLIIGATTGYLCHQFIDVKTQKMA